MEVLICSFPGVSRTSRVFTLLGQLKSYPIGAKYYGSPKSPFRASLLPKFGTQVPGEVEYLSQGYKKTIKPTAVFYKNPIFHNNKIYKLSSFYNQHKREEKNQKWQR